MNATLKSASDWSPVIVKGALWVAISGLTAAQAELSDITPDLIATMTWVDWTNSSLSVILASLIGLRLFMDSSVARHSDTLAEKASLANPKINENTPKPLSP